MATIPAGTVLFSGYGDSGDMRFFSPAGLNLGQPDSAPNPGAGVNNVIALPVSKRISVIGGNAPNFGTTGTGVFNTDLTFRAEYGGTAFGGNGGGRDDTDGFYSARVNGTNLKIARYDADANQTQVWTIASGLASPTVKSLGVVGDGSTAYVAMTDGVTSSGASTVYKVSLAGAGSIVGVFASWGSTGFTGFAPSGVMGLSDGTVLIARKSSHDIVHLSAAGATLHTYTPIASFSPIQLAYGLTAGTFWAIGYDPAVATASGVSVVEIEISTGTVLHQFDPEDGSFEFDSPFTVLLAPVGARTLVLPPRTPTPSGAKEPCNPQAQVSGGGMGAAGCNVGGIGRTPVVLTEFGTVPVHPDADAGETLTGASRVDLWIALHHKAYPSGDITTYRRALVDLADDPDYYGGRKQAGLLTVGDVEHGLGNESGEFEAASCDLHFSDALDRWIRTLLEDEELEGDEIEIYLASPEGRAAGVVPRTIMRGIVQGPGTEASLQASLTAVDLLFSVFGPFGHTPNWPFWTFGDVFPEAPADVRVRALPVLYGSKSDEGAVDPVTGEPREKGLVPWHYVGRITIAGTDANATLPTSESSGVGAVDDVGILGGFGSWLSDGTVTNDPYHFVARVVDHVMGPLNGGRSSTPTGAGVAYGFRPAWNDSGAAPDYYIVFQVPKDYPTWDPFTNPAPTGTNIRYKTVGATPSHPYPDWQFLAFFTSEDDGALWGDATPLEDWDAYGVLHGASYQGGAVFVSDLGGGDPTKTADRTKADLATRNGSDLLWPWNEDGTPSAAWAAVFGAQTYVDQVAPDGSTYRMTMGFARGAISDDHKNGVVNITCNMRAGREDVGDGTGKPLIDAHVVEHHWIDNDLLGAYKSGLWVTNATAPQWPDGTYKLRSSRFLDRQAFTASSLGGRGLTVGWYVGEAKAIPAHLLDWNMATETVVGLNGHGQISLGYIDETVDPSTWPRVRHETDVFGQIGARHRLFRENAVTASCDWDPEAQKFRIGPLPFANEDAIGRNKGQRKPGDEIASPILDDEDQLRWVMKRRLARLGNGLTVLQLPGAIGLLDVDVDDPGVQLTTIEGTGTVGGDEQVGVDLADATLTVRLTPPDLKKSGGGFDLAMAAAVALRPLAR